MYRPQTSNELFFVSTLGAQAACITILELIAVLQYLSWVNPVVYQVPSSYAIPVNFGTFVFGVLLQAVLGFDAVYRKNTLQVFSLCFLNAGLFVSAALRYGQALKIIVSLSKAYTALGEPLADPSIDIWSQIQPFFIASSVLAGIGSLIVAVFAFRLQKEFAWSVYRHLSGSLSIRRRYRMYEILLVLVKCELYFFAGFIITYGFLDVHYELPEFPLTMCLIPVVLLQSGLAIYAADHELFVPSLIATVLKVGEVAYFLSRIIVLLGSGWRAKTILKNEMLFFAFVSCGIASAASITAMICTANFGKGLKPLLANSPWTTTSTLQEGYSDYQSSLFLRLDLDA